MGSGYVVSDSGYNNALVQDSRNEVPVVCMRQLTVMSSWPEIILDTGLSLTEQHSAFKQFVPGLLSYKAFGGSQFAKPFPYSSQHLESFSHDD